MANFCFKHFSLSDHGCGMKIGTDGVLLGAWACTQAARSIVDLGAGSGLLAMMMAQRCPEAQIAALEIDASAAEAIASNVRQTAWQDRISISCCDATQLHLSDIDLIVCNPPYFSSTLQSPDQQRAQARHCATLSPVSAIRCAAEWLSPNGSIAMITPANLENDLTYHAELLRMKPWRLCRVSTVRSKAPSLLLSQWRRQDGPVETSNLSIRDSQGEFDPAYRSLTSDFYLKF